MQEPELAVQNPVALDKGAPASAPTAWLLFPLSPLLLLDVGAGWAPALQLLGQSPTQVKMLPQPQ